MTRSAASAFTAPPGEIGGAANIRGIQFQNHVAIKYCLEMLLGNDATEVWCESQDDIAIVRDFHSQPFIEVIQSKITDENNWSISILCQRESKKAGTSILERSLEYDKFSEVVKFRMVTKKDTNHELAILKYPLDSEERQAGGKIESLVQQAGKKVNGFISGNQNTSDYWIRNVVWDFIGRDDLLESDNHIKIGKFAENNRHNLRSFEIKSIYDSLFRIVLDAGGADHKLDPTAKKLLKTDLNIELLRLISVAKVPDDIFGTASFKVEWSDFRHVLEGLHGALNDGMMEDDTSTTTATFDLDEKNQINNMGDEFFNYLVSTYSIIFKDITSFLRAPVNKNIARKYYDVAHEINAILHSLKGSFPDFEIVIQKSYDKIRESMPVESEVSRKTAWALMAYMYFNCDIGKRP